MALSREDKGLRRRSDVDVDVIGRPHRRLAAGHRRLPLTSQRRNGLTGHAAAVVPRDDGRAVDLTQLQLPGRTPRLAVEALVELCRCGVDSVDAVGAIN